MLGSKKGEELVCLDQDKKENVIKDTWVNNKLCRFSLGCKTLTPGSENACSGGHFKGKVYGITHKQLQEKVCESLMERK